MKVQANVTWQKKYTDWDGRNKTMFPDATTMYVENLKKWTKKNLQSHVHTVIEGGTLNPFMEGRWWHFTWTVPIYLFILDKEHSYELFMEAWDLTVIIVWLWHVWNEDKWCNRENKWDSVLEFSFALTFVFYCLHLKLRMLPIAWNVQDSPFSRLWSLRV